MRYVTTTFIFTLGIVMGSLHSLERTEALPLVDIGPKIGYGTGMFSEDPPVGELTMTSLAFGVAASLDLVLIQLEADLLYLKNTTEASVNDTKTTDDADFLSIPIIGRIDLSPVPMVKFAVGGGYERRFFLGDGESPELNYVPLSARADLKVPMIGAAGVEARFNYQLGDEDIKVHEFMLYLHAFL